MATESFKTKFSKLLFLGGFLEKAKGKRPNGNPPEDPNKPSEKVIGLPALIEFCKLDGAWRRL